MPSSSSWIRAEDVSFWSRHIVMLPFFPRVPMIGAVIYGCHSRSLSYVSQASQLKQCGEVSKFLDRRWMLHTPGSKVHQIMFSGKQNEHGDDLFGNLHFSINAYPKLGKFNIRQKSNSPSFYIVRDDLLHPLINGNKARKLDALLPIIEDYGGTDVVTCGGCQSAHAAAVAVSCAERGLTSHLLLRGEQPGILTGYNLISTMYGNVVYVPRSLYAKREEMLLSHAKMLAGPSGSVASFTDFVDTFAHSSQESNFMRVNSRKSSNNPPKKIVLVNEGAGDAVALLGVFRLVQYLSQPCILGRERSYRIVVDAGTGTTAVGLAIAALCLGLPWKIMAVMLADKIDGYKKQQMRLVSDFSRCFNSELFDHALGERDNKLVHWVDRCKPRKFGIVLNGEVKACQRVAKQTGVLLDPIYTLSAWELATLLCQEGDDVVMLHTGGTLGMFGLAQRYSSHFCSL